MAAASSTVDAWSRVLDRYPIDWRRVTTTCRSNETEQRCYGEPTAHGLEELRTRWPRECRLNDENASFIDVGSGFGRLALYIRLLHNVRSVRGACNVPPPAAPTGATYGPRRMRHTRYTCAARLAAPQRIV